MKEHDALWMLVAVLPFVLFAGCVGNPDVGNEKYCASDADCACGTHKDTDECFFGNRLYVNEERQCPDYCGGIAGNLVIKCAGQRCIQTDRNRECSSDSDCVPEQCCHPTACMNKAYKTVCTVLCTAVCQGPIDCGAGKCACANGTCTVESLGDQSSGGYS